VRGRNSDNTRLRKVLGWEPSIRLEQGLAATYEWIASQLRAEVPKRVSASAAADWFRPDRRRSGFGVWDNGRSSAKDEVLWRFCKRTTTAPNGIVVREIYLESSLKTPPPTLGPFLYTSVHWRVTNRTQRDQVCFIILAGVAAKFSVVNFEVYHRAA